jgi:hypothetical protein
MKQQLAVEWLIEQLNKGEFLYNEIIEQAKQMQKEQLFHFYACGTFDEYSRNVRNAEELYNETFKQQEQ